MEVITTHINADFDSLGSMIAAKKLYPEAVCVFPGSQEKTLRQFFVSSTVYASDFMRAKNVKLDTVTRLILVDASHSDRIGNFAELIGNEDVDLHVYDHHPATGEELRASVAKIERVGATTTLLVEILKEKRIPFTSDEATLMLLGIYEDTGSLTFATTTPRDLYAAGYLLSQGADLSAVSEFIPPDLNADQIALLDDLLRNKTVEDFNGVGVLISEASREGYVGDLAVLVHKMGDIENVEALVVFVRMEDRIHLVARSKVAELDISRLAADFGGGGHPEAASATIKELTLFQVREKLWGLLPKLVRQRTSARDIWTSPVKSVDANTSLEKVRNQLNRYHINAMPVLKGGKLAGIITRLLIERAMQHGLKDAPVEEYMTTEYSTVDAGAPLEKVKELIILGNQRFLPVLEKESLAGAVTRTDLLRALHHPAKGDIKALSKQVEVRFARKVMKEIVDERIFGLLADIGEMANGRGERAYLVGGMVRDLLMRKANLDVDIVVEGDGVALAAELAKRWGASVHPYHPFRTATIALPDKFKIDVATARTEYYPSPAALPRVEQSSLKLDLMRRDFALNALAMELHPDRFGEVIDFFGGLKDIKDHKIRILHNLSFVEDPTRILRALRFKMRLGFTLGSQTSKLLRNAVENGFMAQAKGRRLFKEWMYILGEEDSVSSVEFMEKYGILKAFHEKMRFNNPCRKLFFNISKVVAWYKLLYLDAPVDVAFLNMMALLEPLGEKELERWIEQFNIANHEGAKLLAARKVLNRALLSLRLGVKKGNFPDSLVHQVISPLKPDIALYLMARTNDDKKRRAVSRYFTQLHKVRTELTGKELQELGLPPGPVYKEVLGGLLSARLDGEISTREEELAWVENFISNKKNVHVSS